MLKLEEEGVTDKLKFAEDFYLGFSCGSALTYLELYCSLGFVLWLFFILRVGFAPLSPSRISCNVGDRSWHPSFAVSVRLEGPSSLGPMSCCDFVLAFH